MEIVFKDINNLKGYENNARTHSSDQVKQIAESMRQFGFNDPIEIDENNVILAGHGRLEAAKLLGLPFVPTVCHKHLSDAQRKAYILANNRLALSAGWDTDRLRVEFEDILKTDVNISLTGFTQPEIDEILKRVEEEAIRDESIPDVPQEPTSQLGDVWILGEHRLMCGDSTSATDVKCLLNDVIPVLMVTDPPYGVEYDASWREKMDGKKRSTGKVTNDERVNWQEAFSLFPGNVIYVWHAAPYTAEVVKSIQDCGFDCIAQIIWVKPHFVLSRGDYHWQHEPCWYAVRSGLKHNWQGKRDQSSVWDISRNENDRENITGHSTQKPLECMSRPIENNSATGDWIYDPFGGSGTTLIACEKLRRRCVMMEISPGYCDVIIKRWQKLSGKSAVREETGEIFSG